MPTAGSLLRHARVQRARLLDRVSADDERSRHARSAGALLMLGAVSGIALLPVLPPHVDQRLALLMATSCLALGLVLPVLPWARWPRTALLSPLAAVLPVIYGAGGLLDGALDYYGLFLPLAFIYLGLAFPPVYCLWLLALCLLATGAVFLGPQPPGVLPLVLLGSVLSGVCGTVLAVQRRTEAHGHQAMRRLVEAATSLGGAADEDAVARIVAEVSRDLMGADGVEVLLLGEGEPATVVAATVGEPVRDPARDTPREQVRRLAGLLATTGASTRAGTEGLVAVDRVGAVVSWGARHRRARLVVPVPGDAAARGAIVLSPAQRGPAGDRSAARTLVLLAAEAGRVLDRLAHTRQLLRRARTDPLTGLANRSALQDALDASAPGDVFVLVDLDHFKQVNDTFGHAAGDQVLSRFAAVLRGVSRPGQVVARFGGEEFAMLLPGLDGTAVHRHLAALRTSWLSQAQGVTYSSGVAVRQSSETPAQALARADEALYRAKGGGRDQDCHHPGPMSHVG